MTRASRTGRLLAVPVFLIVAAVACRESEPASVRLRFDYREGDTLRYEYAAHGSYTVPDTAGGPPARHTYDRAMRIQEVAEDVTPSGEYRLAVTYYVTPDSGAPRTPPVTIHLGMTSQGRILDVSGVETARPIFGDIDFRSYFEQAQPVFPDRPLKVGDSWTQEVKVVAPGAEPVTTTSTYVLRALTEEEGEPVATVAFDGEIYLPIRQAAPGQGGQLAEQRIRVRGTLAFDHERGAMRSVETTSRATLTKLAVEEGATTRREIQIEEQSRIRLVGE